MQADRNKFIDEAVKRITDDLTDKGRIIEAGWASYRLMTLPPNASLEQLDEMKTAFYAGAQHLWGSIMTTLDPDKEPTDQDLMRMDHIHKELDAFVNELKMRLTKTAGSA